MNIATFGARHASGQVVRIDEGFAALGHTLVDHPDADLLYSNNAPYTDLIARKLERERYGLPFPRLICTVLDIPVHLLPDFDLEKLSRELAYADAVCSISEYVQWQLRHYIGVESTVIYQPIMAVKRDPHPRTTGYSRFLHVGRRYDSNKRAKLGVQALQLLGVTYNQLGLVGNEQGGWGEYLGVLDERHLNSAYNAVDFVMATSKVEGLCLPVLEAMAAGVIPVVCADMTTRKELLPPALFPEYETVERTPQSVAAFISRFLHDNDAMAQMKDRLYQHFTTTWADRVSGLGVAKAIMNVYDTLPQ